MWNELSANAKAFVSLTVFMLISITVGAFLFSKLIYLLITHPFSRYLFLFLVASVVVGAVCFLVLKIRPPCPVIISSTFRRLLPLERGNKLLQSSASTPDQQEAQSK